MKRIITITAIAIACIFGFYIYLTWGSWGNPRFMHHRYNRVITEPLAKIGFTDAQWKMGVFHIVRTILPPSEEYDVKRDIENAIYWWAKASTKGNSDATEELPKAKELLLEIKLSEAEKIITESNWENIPDNYNKLLGELSRSYIESNQHNKAIPLADKMIEFINRTQEPICYARSWAYYNKAYLHISTSDYTSGLEYTMRALLELEKLGMQDDELYESCLLLISDIERAHQ